MPQALVEGARVLALVDSLLARARFARDYDCVAPAITLDQIGCTSKAPAIRCLRSVCAPRAAESSRSRLNSPRRHRQLIISGPNTGGKTVTLKTTALLAMMAQAGVAGARDGGQLSCLSLHSSPTSATRSRLKQRSPPSPRTSPISIGFRGWPDAHSLVLLDELGSATDPEEGSALAVAVAELLPRPPARGR